MSPVERRTRSSTTTAVIVGIAGVVAAVGLVVLMVNLASQGGEAFEVRLGDDRFNAGIVTDRAASIERDGPVLFPDVAGRNRDLILQHLGEEPDEGWYAFSAQAAGKPRECTLEWQPEDEGFEDCDGEVFPADGDHPAITNYPVTIEDNRIWVDINFEFRDTADDEDAE
jgi:hypothetical protein